MDKSTPSRVCCSCKVAKPLSEYHRYSRSPDGRQKKCKECCAAYQREYNRIHGETRAQRRAAQAAANLERERAAKRRWAILNAERKRETRHRRRARLRAAVVGEIDLSLLDAETCGLCGDAIDPDLVYPDPMSRSLDHVVPLASGGSHAQDNLQWAHWICNVRKGSRLPSPDDEAEDGEGERQDG